MGIKIIVEGETPLAALADLAVAARYMLHSPEVRVAADHVMEIDMADITPVSQRTEPPVTLDVGRQPAHHAHAPASGATSPGVVPNQNQNQAAPNGYPGNGGAQNPPTPNNGYGYPVNPQNQPPVGAQGGAQGNPTSGMSGANPAMTTQTSLFNGQPATHPGPGSVPVSGAPAFTVAQVGKAGADLVTANPARRNELNALLQHYGVQSVSELRPEQLAPFAQELRGLGANI